MQLFSKLLKYQTGFLYVKCQAYKENLSEHYRMNL